MGSFYGGGCLNGGGGVTDYASLKDAPITVITGRNENNFINLSGLDFGHYNLKGYYKNTSADELQYTQQGFDLVVCYDEVTHKKIVRYFTIESEQMYLNLLIIEEDLTTSFKKKPLTSTNTPDIPWESM